jgi:hypothetical protein
VPGPANGNGKTPQWILGIAATIIAGCLLTVLGWTFNHVLESNQRVEQVLTRQIEGYRRADAIEGRLDKLDERVRQLELRH